MTLPPKKLYAFVINNERKLKEDFAEAMAEALKTYCAKHKLRGAFVCKDKSEDELFAFENGFSEDIDDPGWKPIDEVWYAK